MLTIQAAVERTRHLVKRECSMCGGMGAIYFQTPGDGGGWVELKCPKCRAGGER